MRKNFVIMAVVALMAASGGYFLAMVMNPAGPEPLSIDGSPAPSTADLLGQRRPEFTLSDLQGSPVSAGDFDGQVWLVNFWATWCAPCVEEMPMLSRLQQEYADRGVKFVGIALDDAQRAGDFARELDLSYTVLVGKTDVVITGRRFGNATGMLPFSVLIDAGGIIRWAHLGALSREDLEAELSRITHG